MAILGLSYGFHDSSAAIVENGKVLVAAAEERFSLGKHDDQFPTQAIEACLRKTKKTLDDIEKVAYYENPELKFSRILASSVSEFPNSIREFSSAMQSWMGEKLWVRNNLSKQLSLSPARITHFDHHLCHGASAFFGSGFESAAVLVVDAVGEWATTSIYRANLRDSNEPLELLWQREYPDSLGLFYSAFTRYLGFTPMSGECSTMALAAFGQPIYADLIREHVFLDSSADFVLNREFLNFDKFYKDPYTKKFTALFGPPRKKSTPLSFGCSSAELKADLNEKRHADIASSCQQVFEEILLKLAFKARQLTGEINLCYAGGAALNCVANSRLLTQGSFEHFYIPPDPGDGGTAVGAAYLADHASDKLTNRPDPAKSLCSPYLGETHDGTQDVEVLKLLDPRKTRRHRIKGLLQSKVRSWKIRTWDSFEEVACRTSQLLADYKVVGWFQNRYEFGPRALGHRSILFRADCLETATRVSKRVKVRAAYRPYALSLLQENAEEILDFEGDLTKIPAARWMQLSVPVTEALRPKYCGGIHIDGTTRPQLVASSDCPLFHELLTECQERYGLKALINTSFNESGYPLVARPVDALMMFLRTDLDVLVLGNIIIEKEDNL